MILLPHYLLYLRLYYSYFTQDVKIKISICRGGYRNRKAFGSINKVKRLGGQIIRKDMSDNKTKGCMDSYSKSMSKYHFGSVSK